MDAIVRSISINALTRRKRINEETVGESQLARVLTVFDLTALGVGATLGKINLPFHENWPSVIQLFFFIKILINLVMVVRKGIFAFSQVRECMC